MAAGATYEPIATQTLASAAASITFSSIAASWTDLRLVMTGTLNTGTPAYYPALIFNSDATSNYSCTYLAGSGTAASSSRITSRSWLDCTAGGGWSLTIPSMLVVDIFSYAGSTNKTVLMQNSNDFNGSGSVESDVGLWRSTAAITSIKIQVYNATAGYQFAIGTTATLYGIKNSL